jgi:hypothetical protein
LTPPHIPGKALAVEMSATRIHPLREALYLMGVPFLFGFPLWKTTVMAALNLVTEPSFHWLGVLLFSRSSLGLGLLYCAACASCYAGAYREAMERVESQSDHIKALVQHYQPIKDSEIKPDPGQNKK